MVFLKYNKSLLELDIFYSRKVSANMNHGIILLLPLYHSFSKTLHKSTMLNKKQHPHTNFQLMEGIEK